VSEEHAVEAVTADFVATARPEVVQVEVDGEIVLYDDKAKVMHRLSPSAGQVWRCLDGSGSLAEIAGDLADVYQVDPAQVLSDVVATARQFGSAGLLVGVGDQPDEEQDPRTPGEDADREDPDSPFVAEWAASCMDSFFPLGEAGTLTVKAGPYLLGVRFSTPELVEMAREVLAPSLVEGVVAPPNASVKETSARAGRPLLYCYRSNVLVTRARSPQRALAAVASLLSTYVPPATSRLRLPALVAVRAGVAVLFSPKSWPVAARLVPRLQAAGWDVLDTLEADLDSDAQVVIAPLAVTLDADALAALPGKPADVSRPAPGRYPVLAWVDVADDEPMPETMAGRVTRVAAGAGSLDAASAPSVFETAAAMLRGATWAVSPTFEPNDITETLVRAVS
jgi:hypothetical protein